MNGDKDRTVAGKAPSWDKTKESEGEQEKVVDDCENTILGITGRSSAFSGSHRIP